MKGWFYSMKLLIEQRIFSWTDRFTVRDEGGNTRYTVEGELFSWGKKLHVYDLRGEEVVFIEQEVLRFRPRYRVYVQGMLVCEVVKEFSFLYPRYIVEGTGWDVEGDLFSHEYTVNCGDRPVVHIHKEWFTWGDCYALNIANDKDELQALALVLAIDCAVDQQRDS